MYCVSPGVTQCRDCLKGVSLYVRFDTVLKIFRNYCRGLSKPACSPCSYPTGIAKEYIFLLDKAMSIS